MPPQAASSPPLRERLQRALEDRYTVEAELGRGGVGAVYRAHDRKHGRKVAVKVLLPEVANALSVSRFLQEITIAARLHHPHILPLHDSGEAEGLVFYVMPWVQGESLHDRLTRVKRLPLDDVTRIAGEVGSALDRAHGEGILHRDIKPANILFVGNYAVIADFGIATALDSSEDGVATQVGAIVGTAAYMSPEQAAGATDLDGRSDLYSLGCTVYEMLAGRPPFSGSVRRLLTQHIVEPAPRVRAVRPDVPGHVDEALMKALAKERGDRFPTLMEFANALSRPTSGTRFEGDGLWRRIRSSFVRPDPAARPDGRPAPGPLEAPPDVPDQGAPVRCQGCGSPNAEGSRYCRECGEPLGPTEERGARPAAASPVPESELRQVTVMTIDAVPELGPTTDPEAELEMVQGYQAVCAEAVGRYDGRIVEQGARGVLAYFGHPVAHEDDPIRAALAGLRILSATRAMSRRLEEGSGLRFDVRMGVHTGHAVIGSVGTDSSGERRAVGQTPLLAARLRDRAPPDSLLVSDSTHRLFKGYFSCLELPGVELEESGEVLAAHRVLAESGVGRLSSFTDPEALPPLEGRESELQEILETWGRASSGAAQLVLLRGEAGIGKSRLVAAVRERLAGQARVVLQGGCSPYHTNTALHGMIDLLERWFGILPDDSNRDRLEKLEIGALPYVGDDQEAVPLLADLLSIPSPEGYPSLSLEPGLQRRRALDLLLALLRAVANEGPVLLVMEDLHWVDPSTLEFLTMWLDRGRTSPTMVLLDARRDFAPPWDAPHVTRIELAGLGVDLVKRIVERVTGGRRLPEELVERIVRLADGVPLFVEETTRSLLESDQVVETEDGYELAGPLSQTRIPLTLRDALTARIDRLGAAKALVQMGAVIGREFPASLLLEISGGRDPASVGAELNRAVDAGILESTGSALRGAYRFRHALIQETAYQSLVRTTREAHHRRIMEALERLSETGEASTELLAHHCTEAGAPGKAITYWRRAGLQAIGRAAFAEAVHHLRRGLDLLESLPEGPDRDLEELLLQTAFGMALQASKGYAAPEVERVYDRARTLARRGGDARWLLPLLWGQYLFYGVRARYRTSQEVGEEMLALARKDGEREHLIVSHLALGLNALYMGEFAGSRRHFRRGIELYEPREEPFHGYHSLGDPGAFCYSYFGRTLWILGEVGEAFECSHRGLTLARTLQIPLSRTQALGMHALLLLLHGDDSQAAQYVAETNGHATRHGFAYWLVLSSMYQGWLAAREGRLEEGIARFQRFLDLYRKQGAELGLSWFYGVLAQMVGRSGRIDEAFGWLERARDHIETTDERYYEAEIHRIRGEMELLRGGEDAADAADACFARALEVARGQYARSWELRAAVSLARLRRDGGRRDEAREALGVLEAMPAQPEPSSDLREARRLLEELGG